MIKRAMTTTTKKKKNFVSSINLKRNIQDRYMNATPAAAAKKKKIDGFLAQSKEILSSYENLVGSASLFWIVNKYVMQGEKEL